MFEKKYLMEGILKAKVYIETSVISYLTARPSNDIRAMANQNVTIEWWETQRKCGHCVKNLSVAMPCP
jgi:L-rhamnose mutarotase